VAFTVGSGGVGLGITANASASKGKGEGQDTSWTNTQVSAGNTVNLQSGGDTTLKGAVVAASFKRHTGHNTHRPQPHRRHSVGSAGGGDDYRG
jgi:hypothetical protein